MSTATAAPAIDVSQTPRVPFLRLVGVEVRKMVDTRAGRWLIGITLGLLLVAMVIALLVAVLNDFDTSLAMWLQVLTVPMSLLMPTIAIIAITQEWGQRTGLTTFALEPHRVRVIAAKLVSVLVLAMATIVFAVVMAVLGNLLYQVFSGNQPGWDVESKVLIWTITLQLAYFVMAFGFGMVFLSTPAAIALYYVVSLLLPMMVYGTLLAFFEWAGNVIPWLDLGIAAAPLYGESMPGVPTDLAPYQFTFAFVLWVVVPVAVGLWRINRVELK